MFNTILKVSAGVIIFILMVKLMWKDKQIRGMFKCCKRCNKPLTTRILCGLDFFHLINCGYNIYMKGKRWREEK